MVGVEPIVEIERRHRIKLCLAALSYDWGHENILTMFDKDWDVLAYSIKSKMSTGHKVMDKFFREEFSPETSMWMGKHPEINKLQKLYFYLVETYK